MAQLHALTRLHLRTEFIRRKLRGEVPFRVKLVDFIDAASDDLIDAVADDENVSGVVGGFGDGSVIAAILAWLQSEQGKAFINTIFKLILGLLAV